MSLSAINSLNPTACIAFIMWVIFHFIFYFLTSYTLFYFLSSSTILQIYLNTFFLMGFYALVQFLFSTLGIILPGVTQFIFHVARGQAFAYEPSFYALYMTPFMVIQTTQFILSPPEKRNLSHLICAHLFFLISTSTGCFFSYLIYFSQLILLKYHKIITINLKKHLLKSSVIFISIFYLLWSLNHQLITHGLLKFFFSKHLHSSLAIRWQGMIDYWNIFLEYPLFGVGLGSGPFYLAQQKLASSVDLLDPAIVAHYSPTNILTEIFASLGLTGIALFTIFLFLLFETFYKTFKIFSLSSQERINLIAIALSVSVMLMTLQFNQSLMRSYVWVHIGIFVGYADSLRKRYPTKTFLLI